MKTQRRDQLCCYLRILTGNLNWILSGTLIITISLNCTPFIHQVLDLMFGKMIIYTNLLTLNQKTHLELGAIKPQEWSLTILERHLPMKQINYYLQTTTSLEASKPTITELYTTS